MTFPVSLAFTTSLVLLFCSSAKVQANCSQNRKIKILGQQEIVRYHMALFFTTVQALIIQLTKYSEK